ncbi:hypothetical protein LTR08_002735 [Meristemomyces frigidus]|nr:hypothetical protein LTR08_002735 [Meristemomyces frigidus]
MPYLVQVITSEGVPILVPEGSAQAAIWADAVGTNSYVPRFLVQIPTSTGFILVPEGSAQAAIGADRAADTHYFDGIIGERRIGRGEVEYISQWTGTDLTTCDPATAHHAAAIKEWNAEKKRQADIDAFYAQQPAGTNPANITMRKSTRKRKPTLKQRESEWDSDPYRSGLVPVPLAAGPSAPTTGLGISYHNANVVPYGLVAVPQTFDQAMEEDKIESPTGSDRSSRQGHLDRHRAEVRRMLDDSSAPQPGSSPEPEAFFEHFLE